MKYAALTLVQPGVLSLLVDQGRQHLMHTGLTVGGAMDGEACYWANRLCDNEPSACVIESLGGFEAVFDAPAWIAVTGAQATVRVNGSACAMWTGLQIASGDRLEITSPSAGLRIYLGISGGFQTPLMSGSRSTIMREGLGGLHQNGAPLRAGDKLAFSSHTQAQTWQLARDARPTYGGEPVLRVVEGYQHQAFSTLDKQRFYSSVYQLTAQMDRMGIRLSGVAIRADIKQLQSEGICLGAIQFPADGQPIVLMQDRQTIGGYPKIGSVLSLDCNVLSQCVAGQTVRFEAISIEQAHNLLSLAHYRRQQLSLETAML